MRIAILLVLLAIAKPAFADEDPEPVDEDVAFALSLGGTLASWGAVLGAGYIDGEASNAIATIGLVGTFVAPSAGHWYADRYLTRGLGARTAGVLSFATGVAMVADCIGEHAECSSGVAAGTLLLVGVGLYGYGTLHDIFTAPRSARARNAEVARALAIAPMITPTTTGLAVGGSF